MKNGINYTKRKNFTSHRNIKNDKDYVAAGVMEDPFISLITHKTPSSSTLLPGNYFRHNNGEDIYFAIKNSFLHVRSLKFKYFIVLYI